MKLVYRIILHISWVLSLLLAGLLFGRNFGRALHAAAGLQNKTEHEGE